VEGFFGSLKHNWLQHSKLPMALPEYIKLRTCAAPDGTPSVADLMYERFTATSQLQSKVTLSRSKKSPQESQWGQKNTNVPYDQDYVSCGATVARTGKKCTTRASPGCITSSCGHHCSQKGSGCTVHQGNRGV
jgi:hypothetical protein